MKWVMVVMLMAGLSGCHWLDQTRVTGTGAVVERQQALGNGVTRVLAGVPAPPSGSGGSRAASSSRGRRTSCPIWS